MQRPGSLPYVEQFKGNFTLMWRCNSARADFAAGIAHVFFTKENYLRLLVNY